MKTSLIVQIGNKHVSEQQDGVSQHVFHTLPMESAMMQMHNPVITVWPYWMSIECSMDLHDVLYIFRGACVCVRVCVWVNTLPYF